MCLIYTGKIQICMSQYHYECKKCLQQLHMRPIFAHTMYQTENASLLNHFRPLSLLRHGPTWVFNSLWCSGSQQRKPWRNLLPASQMSPVIHCVQLCLYRKYDVFLSGSSLQTAEIDVSLEVGGNMCFGATILVLPPDCFYQEHLIPLPSMCSFFICEGF